MTQQGWRQIVIEAVRRADDGDPKLLDLTAQVLAEQDRAKHKIRELGFGCTGMPWSEMYDEIRQYVDSHPTRDRSHALPEWGT